MTTEQPLAVTPRDAAHLTSLGLTSIWKLIGENRLEVVRIGRSTRVKMSSIRQLIDGSEA